jgi:DNA-binding CsgD family transcriptional regulator
MLAELPRLWLELLQARRLDMHLFIDDALPGAQCLQGVASGVFVNDDFADALLAGGTPMLARQVMRAEASGRSVILSRAQAAAANGGAGVNAVELDFAFACDDWSVAAARRWTPAFMESLRLWLDGWRLRMALRECIGRDLYQRVRATGCLLQDHAAVDGQRMPHARARYLMGMTREQSRRLPLAMASMLFFNEREPRFRFTLAQQDLLLLALGNHSDAECAEQLRVSPHTVKMRWRSIFEQVAEQRPDWFPVAHASDGQRGVEKRRHLLAYLARHMEELRPHARGSMAALAVA